MRFNKSWIDELVPNSLTADELAAQITMAGLEVDSVEPAAGAFHGVVVGEVVSCGQHPNADKLHVTKVNVGGPELLDIVCGAPNCRQGLRVAVATVGAVLPGDFVIKKAKLRGEPSLGMLCSFSELGISADHSGIIELPVDAPIGQDLRDYLHLNDSCIEVDLTANRSDCLGMLGLAREIAALNRTHYHQPEFAPVSSTLADQYTVQVLNAKECPRYVSRVLKGLNVQAKTPLWMQERLRRCGLRSIDPVVDVTNYVMLLLGQPMHAYDLQQLQGPLQVRLAHDGEKLVLLDDNEATLRADTLVIADDRGAIAMAGIFGGLATGVTATTADVLLESAFFDPLSITGRARNYGLRTDASHRFERGVDPTVQQLAIDIASSLLIEICGGACGPVTEIASPAHLPAVKTVALTRKKLTQLVGIAFADAEVVDILTRLGMQVTATADGWSAQVPSWRFDIAIAEDLVEEVARVHGYNNIPNLPPVAQLTMSHHQEAIQPLKRVRDLLVARGFHEAITYSFIEPELLKTFNPDADPMILPNPIASDMSAMRVSLLPGLVNTVVYNQNRQQSRIRLFETGLRFVKDATAENGIRQESMLAGIITGTASNENWAIEERTVDFFDLKGDLEAVLELTATPEHFHFVAGQHAAMHPGQTAAILCDDKTIGYIGVIHPSFEKKLGLKSKAIVFELELSAVLNRAVPAYTDISKFPANRRDLAFVVDQTISADQILRLTRKVGGNQVVGINLFDVYQGAGVADGKKSLALSVTLQHTDRTLEEKEIAETIDHIVDALRVEFNATLRD